MGLYGHGTVEPQAGTHCAGPDRTAITTPPPGSQGERLQNPGGENQVTAQDKIHPQQETAGQAAHDPRNSLRTLGRAAYHPCRLYKMRADHFRADGSGSHR